MHPTYRLAFTCNPRLACTAGTRVHCRAQPLIPCCTCSAASVATQHAVVLAGLVLYDSRHALIMQALHVLQGCTAASQSLGAQSPQPAVAGRLQALAQPHHTSAGLGTSCGANQVAVNLMFSRPVPCRPLHARASRTATKQRPDALWCWSRRGHQVGVVATVARGQLERLARGQPVMGQLGKQRSLKVLPAR